MGSFAKSVCSICFAAGGVAVLALPAPGGPLPLPDEGYSLLNPKPREAWRPLSADRPDVTESPYTVDAGAVQIEASFVSFVKDGGDRVVRFAPLNLKIGILEHADLQFVFDPLVHADIAGVESTGVGDIEVRAKFNMWGNDGGLTAAALMPYVKIPSVDGDIGNGKLEGGLIAPFAVSITDIVSLGLMAQGDIVYDEIDDDYDFEFVHSATVGVGLTERWGVYGEAVGIASTDSSVDYRALLGSGATYAVSDNTVLDFGINLGVTGDVEDAEIFAGITVRF